ncbi:MAG: cell division protein FtsQ/DivIB [Candidatus Limnocylindria bacterium]
MKLKPQPRPTRRATRRSGPRAGRPSARSRGRGARRPGIPFRRRLAGRLPSLRRTLAALGAIAAGAGLVWLLDGPWLRVTEVAWTGDRYTAAQDLEHVLEPQRGGSVLAVDTRALTARIERMPAVASATVAARLPGRIEATIVEREAAFVWQTSSGRLIGSADGVIFAAMPGDEALPDALGSLPVVTDERAMARLLRPGDRISDIVLRTALRLADLDPAALGSAATQVGVRLDDEYGFGIVSSQPAWEIAFGVVGSDPRESAADAAAKIERQVAAVRTLFASQPESEVGWVDARNPGKVYFRDKG